jgi:hypothetical protein
VTVPVKLAVFAAVLAAVFALALLAGRAVEPLHEDTPASTVEVAR